MTQSDFVRIIKNMNSIRLITVNNLAGLKRFYTYVETLSKFNTTFSSNSTISSTFSRYVEIGGYAYPSEFTVKFLFLVKIEHCLILTLLRKDIFLPKDFLSNLGIFYIL